MSIRNKPDTKHRRICVRMRRDLIQGKQKRKFLGGFLLLLPLPPPVRLPLLAELPCSVLRRRVSPSLLRRLLSSLVSPPSRLDPPLPSLLCLPDPPLASLLCLLDRLLPLATALSGSVTSSCPAVVVPGLVGGPLLPPVHTLSSPGKCSLVLGSACSPILNAGLFGLSTVASCPLITVGGAPLNPAPE